jgi:hypothetical protein
VRLAAVKNVRTYRSIILLYDMKGKKVHWFQSTL